MSVHVMSWVWKHSQSRMGDRLVLLAIADNADSDGRNAWPSILDLMVKAGMSRRNVFYAIEGLKELGELTVEKTLINGRWRNCYRVLMSSADIAPVTGASIAPHGQASSAMVAPPEVQTTTPTGANHDTLYKEEPSEPSSTVLTAVVAIRDSAPTARTLVAEWIDNNRKRPPQSVIGQVAKHVGALLAEGIDYGDVRRGLQLWQSKGLHPSTLASVVNEVMNSQSNGSPKTPTTDQRVMQAINAGRAVAAAEGTLP